MQLKRRASRLPRDRSRAGAVLRAIASRELTDWDDVKLLTVAVDRLQQWYRPGLLCIGDAAHAMSPIGGVGINLAIQDAVAAANILCRAVVWQGPPSDRLLAQVQKRREWPTKVIQGMQVIYAKEFDFSCPRRHRQSRAAMVYAALYLLFRSCAACPPA